MPLYLLSWKIAPAIAVGNTAIAKPSELTPMTAYLLCEICAEAGLPNGVLNIVHGTGPNVGAPITAHPKIGTISFTGGTVTGPQGCGDLRADVQESFARAWRQKSEHHFRRRGSRRRDCWQRPLLLREPGPGLSLRLARVRRALRLPGVSSIASSPKSSQLKQGDPLEEKTEQGAIVSKTQLDKVKFYVDLAQKEGGKIALGGKAPDSINDRCRDGYFFPPTVLTDLPVSCRTNREEIFGPVVTITPFDNEEEVIGYANDNEYGLASSVWTQNLSRAHRVAEKIHTGTVWVNCWLVRDLRVPFGGMKQSGVGREGGEEALRFFTEPKNVCIAK